MFAADKADCCSCCIERWLFVDASESVISVFGGSDDSDMPESVTLEDTIDDIPSIE